MNARASTHRLPWGVCAYSFPASCGFLRREGDVAPTAVMDANGLIACATTYGLASVEMPLQGMLPDLTPPAVDWLREALATANLPLVVDTGVVDAATLAPLLPLAARAGARVVRAMLSTILEGARACLAGGWAAHIEEMQRRIVALRPALEAYDLVLALENHQDATSDDLLALCEAGGGRVGVTLDVANPLAVGEDPLHFARKVGRHIRNVHLKDYRVYMTASGYRLVRCALGDGVIPFGALLPLLREVAPGAHLHIELAALYARHIRLLEDDWWSGYPTRDVREVLPVLRLAAQQARPATEGWQTPWEREAPLEEIRQYERDQFNRSVRYLETLIA
ncbi:MAG TPA: TIM barrel protein [Herpetosiphonaceae bacterium]|nr:TIM barrel protein [Herpetosiphonaceae bacterium]